MVNGLSSPTLYVGLGSNLGDRAGNLLRAVSGLIDARFHLDRLSRVYETEPVDTFTQPFFLNMVAELRTREAIDPEEVMTRLLRVEHSLGRTRDLDKGPRTIDLDLLLYGNVTSQTQLLTLPHPRMHQRKFVLQPLAELAPQLVHPALNKTVTELLNNLVDVSEVKLWQP